MIRARIRIDTNKEVIDFVKRLNSEGTINKYLIEDKEGEHRVNARSYLGVIYATAEFGDYMYFVNATVDGDFPEFIDDYRHPGEDGNYIHK